MPSVQAPSRPAPQAADPSTARPSAAGDSFSALLGEAIEGDHTAVEGGSNDSGEDALLEGALAGLLGLGVSTPSAAMSLAEQNLLAMLGLNALGADDSATGASAPAAAAAGTGSTASGGEGFRVPAPGEAVRALVVTPTRVWPPGHGPARSAPGAPADPGQAVEPSPGGRQFVDLVFSTDSIAFLKSLQAKQAARAAGAPTTAVPGGAPVAGVTAAFEGAGVTAFAAPSEAIDMAALVDGAVGVEPGATQTAAATALTRAGLAASPLMAAALNFAERMRADQEASDTEAEALGASLTGITGRADAPGSSVATTNAPSTGREVAVPLPMLASEIARQAERGKKSFDIRLDPPELGKVRVKLDLGQEGDVRAHLIVERKETLDLLQRDQRVLEQALKTAGLELGGGGLQFSMSDGGGQSAYGEPAAASPRRSTTETDASPPASTLRAGQSANRRPSGVDVHV